MRTKKATKRATPNAELKDLAKMYGTFLSMPDEDADKFGAAFDRIVERCGYASQQVWDAWDWLVKYEPQTA